MKNIHSKCKKAIMLLAGIFVIALIINAILIGFGHKKTFHNWAEGPYIGEVVSMTETGLIIDGQGHMLPIVIDQKTKIEPGASALKVGSRILVMGPNENRQICAKLIRVAQ